MPALTNKRGIVLVADDDPVMRLLMIEMLGQVGLDGIEAEDGRQAVASSRDRVGVGRRSARQADLR